MLKVIKPSNPFTNVCCFCFNNISAPPQIWLHDVFFCPIPVKRRNDGDGFGAIAAGLF